MLEQIEIGDFFLLGAVVTGQDPHVLKRVSDIALAEAATSAAFRGYEKSLFFPDPIERAAITCSRIIQYHPLPDGNKRTGYLALKYQLQRAGLTWLVPNEDDAVLTVQALAAGTITETAFVGWVRSNVAGN